MPKNARVGINVIGSNETRDYERIREIETKRIERRDIACVTRHDPGCCSSRDYGRLHL